MLLIIIFGAITISSCIIICFNELWGWGLTKKLRLKFKALLENKKLDKNLKKIKEGKIYKNIRDFSYSKIIFVSKTIIQYRSGFYDGIVLSASPLGFISEHDLNPITIKIPESGEMYIHHHQLNLKAVIDKIVGDKVYYFMIKNDDAFYYSENLSIFALCWKLEENT